jgi:hypothetical protein
VWQRVSARPNGRSTPSTTSTTTTIVVPRSDTVLDIRIRGGKRCVRTGDEVEVVGYFAHGDRGIPTISMARVFGGRDPRNGPVATVAPRSVTATTLVVVMPEITSLPNGDSTLDLVSVMFTWGPFTTAGVQRASQLRVCGEFATTGTTVPVSSRATLVRTLAGYDFNTGRLPSTNVFGFQYAHHTWSQIGQSFVFDRTMRLESLLFLVAGFTVVSDLDVYNRTPEPMNHAMENYDYSAEVPMRLHLSLWRSPSTGPLLGDVETARDVQLVYTQTSDHTFVAGAPIEVSLARPVTVGSGNYLVALRLEATTEWVRRRILTLWVAGQQSGNAVRGGYERTMERNCTYTRGDDIYPNGRAYKAAFVEPYSDWQSAPSRTYQTLFTEHRAKVSQCIEPGVFADIFNDGDLVMEWRGTVP